mmetsp:Transcript_1446/g.1722  ORF Transcript_1446/g.1722 Transcript_1446/m.1722 type:complete len:208 (+) Transcript_1446:167-790(+)
MTRMDRCGRFKGAWGPPGGPERFINGPPRPCGGEPTGPTRPGLLRGDTWRGGDGGPPPPLLDPTLLDPPRGSSSFGGLPSGRENLGAAGTTGVAFVWLLAPNSSSFGVTTGTPLSLLVEFCSETGDDVDVDTFNDRDAEMIAAVLRSSGIFVATDKGTHAGVCVLQGEECCATRGSDTAAVAGAGALEGEDCSVFTMAMASSSASSN